MRPSVCVNPVTFYQVFSLRFSRHERKLWVSDLAV